LQPDADKTITVLIVLESLLALRLLEESLEIRERRLLTRDRRIALRIEIVTRVVSTAVLVLVLVLVAAVAVPR
jgi:hypothetical protein